MRWNNIRSFHKGEKRSENLYLSDHFNIKRQIKCLLTHGKYVIITSDIKSAKSGFYRAKARLAAHRTSENILPLNLLSDDKIRRTAVSVYTDLIYGIITSDLKSAEADFAVQKHGLRYTACLRTLKHDFILPDRQNLRHLPLCALMAH